MWKSVRQKSINVYAKFSYGKFILVVEGQFETYIVGCSLYREPPFSPFLSKTYVSGLYYLFVFVKDYLSRFVCKCRNGDDISFTKMIWFTFHNNSNYNSNRKNVDSVRGQDVLPDHPWFPYRQIAPSMKPKLREVYLQHFRTYLSL